MAHLFYLLLYASLLALCFQHFRYSSHWATYHEIRTRQDVAQRYLSLLDLTVRKLLGSEIVLVTMMSMDHSKPLQLGFIGLGAMGQYMARNLALHPHTRPAGSPPLLVFNRTIDKARAFRDAHGAENVVVAEDLDEMVRACDVVFSCLANDAAVRNTYGAIVKALGNAPDGPQTSKSFVEMSTIFPALAGELDGAISAFPGCHLLTSPIFGRPPAADKAQLLAIVAGDRRVKSKIIDLLVPAVARKVHDLGENLEKAPMMKLIGNSMLYGASEVIGEAFTLAQKAGISPDRVYTFIEDMIPAPPLLVYGQRMRDSDFDGTTGFSLEGGIKDNMHIRNLSHLLSCPMPVLDIVLQNHITARALHEAQLRAGNTEYDVLDSCALIHGLRAAAGLQTPTV